MEMCAGALIPRRTLSRPIRSTWISISFPMMSFSSFFRVTTSIEILWLPSILGESDSYTGFRMTCPTAYRKPGDRARAHSSHQTSPLLWNRSPLQKRLACGETGICKNDLFAGHPFAIDEERGLEISCAGLGSGTDHDNHERQWLDLAA